MSDYKKPLPQITPANRPFWDGARDGRLVLQRCSACGKSRFPAAPVCDACLGAEANWEPVSGLGTVWSACEFHRAYFPAFEPDLPYNVTLVKLDAGPRLYTNLIGLSYPAIKVGQRVEAVFERVTDTVTLVKFRPIAMPDPNQQERDP